MNFQSLASHLRVYLSEAFSKVINQVRPAILPFFLLLNRVRARQGWVLVLGGTHCRIVVEDLAAAGYKVFLLDATPERNNWKFASGTKTVDVYDSANISDIVNIARRLGCKAVLQQSDDFLIPTFAAVNNRLDTNARFSDVAVAASTNKEVMRRRLADAGLSVPRWSIVKNDDDLDDLPLPAIIKPRYGQGSSGVAYVETLAAARTARAFIQRELDQDSCLYEEFLPDRQFDIEGVIQDGTAHVHLVTEESYADDMPNFNRPSWYLHAPRAPSDLESEILRETHAALAACDFQSGAFHLELKFKDGIAYTIDTANRLGADFFRFTKLVSGIDTVHAYLRLLTDQPLELNVLPQPPNQQILRFYNHTDRPNHLAIQTLARSFANSRRVSLTQKGKVLELTGKEEHLREFLKRVYQGSPPQGRAPLKSTSKQQAASCKSASLQVCSLQKRR
jgi:biotin carboxylase